jgi:hypothetical protein
MKKAIPTLLLSAAVASCHSPKKIVKISNATPQLQLEKTLLWEISGNNLAASSYLFGTMHLLCAGDARLSDSLKMTINKATEIYFEIDLDNIMETLGAIKYLNMNGNKKLSDLLSEPDYQKVKTYFKSTNTAIPLSMMERFKPYFISAMVQEAKFPCQTKDGMEQVIMKEAKKESKTIKGLETIGYQASVFDSIPYEQQAHDLVKMIDGAGKSTADENVKLLDVYKSQDINKMVELTTDEDGIGKYVDLLLYKRNENWVKQMPELMKQSTLLFAVGAGHLGGDRGVIQLLRKKGYTLRPMKHQPSIAYIAAQ